MGIITGAGIMSILMMTSGFLLATRSFLVSSCSRFDLEHETREEEERSMIHQSVLNLPPPQHKVYPNNLFEDKEVGASLRKQQHEKLKLEEWESRRTRNQIYPLLLHKEWLRQLFKDLPPPLSDDYPKNLGINLNGWQAEVAGTYSAALALSITLQRRLD